MRGRHVRHVLVAAALCVVGTRSNSASADTVVGADDRVVEADQHEQRAAALTASKDWLPAALEWRLAADLLASAARNNSGELVDDTLFGRARRDLEQAIAAFTAAERPVEAQNAIAVLVQRHGAKLTPEEQATWAKETARLDEGIGSIKLTGLPPDAVVRVGGQLIPDIALASAFRVRAGKYILEINAPGYKAYTETLTVPGQSTLARAIAMEKSTRPARLAFSSSVEPAHLVLDGKSIGNLPLEFEVTPGPHHYLITAEAHRDVEGDVTVVAGDDRKIEASLAPRWNPSGIAFEPFLIVSIAGRDDTPLNSGVREGTPFTDGSAWSGGAGVRALVNVNALHGLRGGFGVRRVDRGLNANGVSLELDWCPNALHVGGESFSLTWCPVSLSYVYYYGVQLGPFRSNQGFDALTRLKVGSDRYALMIGAGVTYDAYKRGSDDLGVATFVGNLGFSFEL